MHYLFIYFELGTLMLFVVFSLIVAAKASKLAYSQNEQQLNYKTRKLLFWSVCLSFLTLGIAAADLILASMTHPQFWTHRLLIHTPFAIIPVLLIWLGSYPKMRRLIRRTNARTDNANDVARRRQASDPVLIVPFQLAPLCSFAMLYFAFIPPHSFRWSFVTMTTTFFLFIACIVWMLQTHRNQLAAEAPPVYRPWLRKLRHTGVLLVILAILGIPFMMAFEGNRLSERLSIIPDGIDEAFSLHPSERQIVIQH
ncbi:hypothetical protein MHH56_31905 [Paenibacillus sp. FSL K6-3182]|uniref:hypothetical protein n=1 Tax=Paenibacillus sp. FSL K6-3182 TaxID=2921495 RepID=UPI0030D0DBC1